MSVFTTALQIYAKRTGKYRVPARGTPQYNEVMRIVALLKQESEQNKKRIAKKTIKKKKIVYLDSDNESIDDVLDGEGFKEVAEKVKKTAKNLLDAIFNGIRTTPPPKIKKLIETYGQVEIVEMNVCRSPVQKVLTKVIDLLTGGKLKQNIKKLHYDDIYHLYILVRLKNGIMLRLEKNQVVNLSTVNKILDSDCINIPLNKALTLGEMIAQAAEKDKDFWVYDAITNNCQVFVDKILTANGLNSERAKKFVLQSAEELINRDPKVQKAAKFVTDLANRFDVLIEGRGFGNRKRKH